MTFMDRRLCCFPQPEKKSIYHTESVKRHIFLYVIIHIQIVRSGGGGGGVYNDIIQSEQ